MRDLKDIIVKFESGKEDKIIKWNDLQNAAGVSIETSSGFKCALSYNFLKNNEQSNVFELPEDMIKVNESFTWNICE